MKKYRTTKHILILPLMILLILGSCGKEEEIEPGVTVKWDITIDGQTYSYEDRYTESSNMDECAAFFQTNGGIPEAGGQIIISGSDGITIQIASADLTGTGSYVFNEDSDGHISILHGMNAYSSDVGSTTVNINTFPLLVWSATENLEGTISKGDFSGTIGDINGVVHNISGSFEAIRVQ